MLLSLLALSAHAAPAPAQVVEIDAAIDWLGPIPEVGAPSVFVPPTPGTATTLGGRPVWVVEDHVLPIVSVVLSVAGGSSTDPAGKAGRAALADQMMRQGAGERDATAFAALVEREAIELDVSTGREGSTISFTCNRDKLDLALDLVADMILRPTLLEEDLVRERGLEVAALEQADNEPGSVASRLAWAAWWGADHPYGHPSAGLADTLGTLTRKDAKAYHKAYWTPTTLTVTAAGDLTAADLASRIDARLGGWKARAAKLPTITEAPEQARTVIAADRPGSAQTTLFLMMRGEGIGEGEALDLGSVVLGGTFTSRLNAKLREEKGYTYGARAGTVELAKGGGVVQVYTSVRTDATGAALADLLGELERAQEGITDDELTKAIGAWRQDVLAAMETRDAAAGIFARWERAGRPPSSLADELRTIEGTTTAAVDEALHTYGPQAEQVLVLVGDKAAIASQLEEIGLTGVSWVE
ncbi:MAG: insulinase family protein [Alphaproteobacteria bacterium]|nr:insulinase family protein [Alphaproteobacteria bacterium]MCB9699561.1 insulinase family protein [Alphaproteobacteria bacterium]